MGRTRTKTTTTTRTTRRVNDFAAPATATASKPATPAAIATPRPDVRAVLDRSTTVAFAELRPGARRAAHAGVVPFICG
ncbi:MAG: hypothetical protein U0625_08475 [Phycisphaerales bacterium]